MPVPEDPLVGLASGAEGVSALAGDAVTWGTTVVGVGMCTTESEHSVHGVCLRTQPE